MNIGVKITVKLVMWHTFVVLCRFHSEWYFVHAGIVAMAQTEESVVKVDLNVVGAEEEAVEGGVEVEEGRALKAVVVVVVVVLALLEKDGENLTATVELTGRKLT